MCHKVRSSYLRTFHLTNTISLIITEMVKICSLPDLYDEIVALTSALLMKSAIDRLLFNTLIELLNSGILSKNVICGYICLEVWNHYIRYVIHTKCKRNHLKSIFFCYIYRQLPNEVRMSYFKFWSNVYNDLNYMPQSPCNVFVKKLLRILFKSLSESEQMLMLWNLSNNNPSAVAALGIEQLKCLEDHKKQNMVKEAELKIIKNVTCPEVHRNCNELVNKLNQNNVSMTSNRFLISV